MCMMVPTLLRNVTNGHVQVEQVPFAPAIVRCHSFNLPQKFDLEAATVVAS